MQACDLGLTKQPSVISEATRCRIHFMVRGSGKHFINEFRLFNYCDN